MHSGSRVRKRDDLTGKEVHVSDRVFAVRVAVINIWNGQNPDVVCNNVDAPNYGLFTGGQGRAITARLRFVERK